MDDFISILKVVENLAVLFGPTLTAVIVIFFIYTRHFKRGNILVIKGNNKNKVENEKEDKERLGMLPHCDERLQFCLDKFKVIESKVAKGDKKSEELEKLARETHTNVAILLERTEILKLAQRREST